MLCRRQLCPPRPAPCPAPNPPPTVMYESKSSSSSRFSAARAFRSYSFLLSCSGSSSLTVVSSIIHVSSTGDPHGGSSP
eukprot:5888291-Pyramimonas_sp.AAC.1